jgi:hypothetical protein
VARNDPTDTGGLFVGRRPGTGPLRYRGRPERGGPGRQRFDSFVAGAILVAETLVLLTLWGPQPIGWLWIGSQVNFLTASVEAGIIVAFAGMIATLMLTLALAKRLDHAWRLARRAAGHDQQAGAIEWIFVASVAIGLTVFVIYFFVIQGPGSQLFSPRAP